MLGSLKIPSLGFVIPILQKRKVRLQITCPNSHKLVRGRGEMPVKVCLALGSVHSVLCSALLECTCTHNYTDVNRHVGEKLCEVFN